MVDTTQFSLRMDTELLREIDEEAQQEYKTRTELIKDGMYKILEEKKEKRNLKRIAAELWLKGELPEHQLKKVISEEEIKDLKFGKRWIEETLHEIRH